MGAIAEEQEEATGKRSPTVAIGSKAKQGTRSENLICATINQEGPLPLDGEGTSVRWKRRSTLYESGGVLCYCNAPEDTDTVR